MNYYGNDAKNYVLVKCSRNDYLMHKQHKYIKRVWKNGKWRYYYKSITGKWKDANGMNKLSEWSGENLRTKAINSYNNAVNQANYNQSIDQYTSYKNPNTLSNTWKRLTDSEYANRQDTLLNTRLSKKAERDTKLDDLKYKADRYLSVYSKTPMGAIETTLGKVIGVGKNFITKRFKMDND